MAEKRNKSCRNFKHKFIKLYQAKNCHTFIICIAIIPLISVVDGAELLQPDNKSTNPGTLCDVGSKDPSCIGHAPRQEQQHKPSESLMALINWLFGPPVDGGSQTRFFAGNNSKNAEILESKPEPKNDQSASTSFQEKSDRQGNKKKIEITDINASVSTARTLHPAQNDGHPSQVNMKDKLDLVEKFDQSVQQRPRPYYRPDPIRRIERFKRESYKPIKVPYTTPPPRLPNLANNLFRQRQLLVNPYEQQMVALQQQQAAAATAAIIQQQQMDALLTANRHALLDDYDRDDDDDSDEDSDELDDLTRFGPPTIEHHHMYLRNGLAPQIPVPPFQRKLGWGLRRRSVADKKRKLENKRKFEGQDKQWGMGRPTSGTKGVVRKYKNRASMRNGQWFLDDYDLNSEFYDRPQERKHLPSHLIGKGDHLEMDEEPDETSKNLKKKQSSKVTTEDIKKLRGDADRIRKFRNSLSPRQEAESTTEPASGDMTTTSASSSTTSENSGEMPTTSEASDDVATTSEVGGDNSSTSEASSSMSPTSEAGGGNASTSETSSGMSSTSEASDDVATTSEASNGMSSTSEASNGMSSTSEAGGDVATTSETGSGDPTTPADSETTSSEGSYSNSTESTTENVTSSEPGDTTTSSQGDTTTSSPGDTTTSASTDPASSTESAGGGMAGQKPKPPYKATLNCRCGTQSVRGEGVGDGTVVRFNVNPWLVAISKGQQHMCSGSIINDRYVLTSKTCVRNVMPSTLNVTAGLTSRNATSYFVSKITTNRDVNLALLQLKTKIKPSHIMRPVCLPIGKRYSGQYSTGTLVTFKQMPPNVQMLDTEVSIFNSSRSKCDSMGKGELCASPPGSVKCGGDTGGVLMVYRGGYSYEQIGVVTDTVGCRSDSTPGVYTDIRKKTRWILNNSKNGNYCKNPPVTDEDLMSSSRFGNPSYVLSEGFDDEFEDEDFDTAWYGHNHQSGKKPHGNFYEDLSVSWEEE